MECRGERGERWSLTDSPKLGAIYLCETQEARFTIARLLIARAVMSREVAKSDTESEAKVPGVEKLFGARSASTEPS